MFTNSNKKEDVINRSGDFVDDVENSENDEFNPSTFYRSHFGSYSKHDRTSDLNAYGHSYEPSAYDDATNERASQSTNEWTSPFKMKKCWNYEAILNDGEYPRIKISAKSGVKKSRSKKSRNDSSFSRNDNSSLHDNNSLKTRLKISSDMKSSRKKSSKQRKKLSVSSLINKSYNGLSSLNSIVVDDSNNKNDVVPIQSNASSVLEASHSLRDNDFTGNETEYAPQYLELKPSVKFKCCRCGTNDFSTMALLQQHMARCDGQPLVPVTANPLLEFSSSAREPKSPSIARNLKIKRKVLLCSSCGTYYQHYNLYVHMRDTHKKEICLFCRSTFLEAQQLWDHLITTHNLSSVSYSSARQVRDAFKSFFITCCSCNAVFSDQEEFGEHECKSYTDEKLEKSICTSCTPEVSQSEPEKMYDKTQKCSQNADESLSANTDDETERTDVPDVDEEPITADSTLNVIGAPDQSIAPSFAERMNTPESASDALGEELVNEDVNKETMNFHEKTEPTLILRDPDSENGSSTLVLFDDASKMECDDEIPLVEQIKIEPVKSTSPQQFNEFSEAVPSMNECQEDGTSVQAVANEDSAAPKIEEKVNKWLESDDEIENVVKAPTENEIAPSNLEPLELPPQPVAMALMLDETVASLDVRTLIRECVRTSCDTCLYCNNAILITVNGGQLASHLRSEHRYMPTKPEDSPEQVVKKIEDAMTDLNNVFMNASLTSTYTEFDNTFACLQCSFSTPLFKELCHHKRKAHHKVIFLCIMCKCNFLYYSQLLCHLCPGLYSPEVQNTLNYHCCFCEQDSIPSAFRLMVHLRKIHQACDICLTRHNDQSELFSHMIKQHKMNHLCYKCNLAYRSRDGINEHLFWKHGTESVLCKRCLQKKWPHAYHFCIPASTYTCEECSRIFTKAVALTVHRRAHNGDFPFACVECEQRFISKKLLAVHKKDVHDPKPDPNETDAAKEGSEDKVMLEQKAENLENDKDGRKRRKKKQKKEKSDIEKPLLDELPPLNLSSESEEDSAEEEVAKAVPEASSASTPEECKMASTIDEGDDFTDSKSKIISDSSSIHEEPSPDADAETKSDSTELLGKTDDNVETPTETGSAENDELSTKNDVAASTLMLDIAKDLLKTNEQSETTNSENATVSPRAKPEVTEPADPREDVEELAAVSPKDEETKSVPSEPMSDIFIIERIRNCLMIEHSYCIPDSIFRSEGPEVETSLETIAQNLSSPKQHLKSHEKSRCKSVTPRKRKRPLKRESSSSDSSSDTDSSSSSCGSNCSCNQKSNSNCSSSSSGSEYSTTPDKKHSKNSANETQADTTVTNDEDEQKKEQDSLLNARESDLDTDLETSDEDFYDKYPSSAPPVEEKSELPVLPVLTMPTARPTTSLPKRESISSRKNRKRRRAPKIKINLGTQDNQSTADISVNLQRVENYPIQSVPTYTPAPFNDSRPGIHLCKTNSGLSYAFMPNNSLNEVCENKNNVSASGDSSGRRSKRERVKNKFYGYSSNEDGSGNEMIRAGTSIKKRPPAKRPPKAPPKQQPFVGIRAKKHLIMAPKRPPQSVPSMSTTMASAYPSLPPHLYRMPSYIMQQHQEQQEQQLQLQRQKQLQQRYRPSSSSSDDSDSGNLVINEPSLNNRSVNNHPRFRFPIYPPAESLDGQRASAAVSTLGFFGHSSVPPKNDEKLYCYCKCPYDEASEMIGCDGENCKYEWFHFECVGIMVPPKGAWYCPQCKNREAVPQFM